MARISHKNMRMCICIHKFAQKWRDATFSAVIWKRLTCNQINCVGVSPGVIIIASLVCVTAAVAHCYSFYAPAAHNRRKTHSPSASDEYLAADSDAQQHPWSSSSSAPQIAFSPAPVIGRYGNAAQVQGPDTDSIFHSFASVLNHWLTHSSQIMVGSGE